MSMTRRQFLLGSVSALALTVMLNSPGRLIQTTNRYGKSGLTAADLERARDTLAANNLAPIDGRWVGCGHIGRQESVRWLVTADA